MSLAYFPLYPDRYEADTAHLSLLEDGAYNRLLRLCWRMPECKLPNDMAWIMRQMRATSETDQEAVKSVLAEFFTKGRSKVWNKKLLEIYVQVSVAHTSKISAGKKGAAAKALKKQQTDLSTAKAELKQPEPEPEPEPKEEREDGGGGSACAREAEILPPQTDREIILAAIGADPVSGLIGPNGRQLGTQADMAEAGRWLALPGMSLGIVCEEIRRIIEAKRDGPPQSFRYFTDAMQRLSGAVTQGALSPITGGQNGHASFDARSENPRVAGSTYPGRGGQGSGIASIAARRRLDGSV